MSKGLEAALLFCCCIAKYYKLRGLKQHIFTVSQFLCLRVWAQLDWCLCSGFHKATVEVLAGLHFYLEAQMGKNPLPSSFGSFLLSEELECAVGGGGDFHISPLASCHAAGLPSCSAP